MNMGTRPLRQHKNIECDSSMVYIIYTCLLIIDKIGTFWAPERTYNEQNMSIKWAQDDL